MIWEGKLTRTQAIKILDKVTNQDDPFWEGIVQDYVGEDADAMPSIMDVFAALGVTKEEYIDASQCNENIDWPKTL